MLTKIFGLAQGLNQGFGSVPFSPVDSNLLDNDQPKNALKMSILSTTLLIIGISNSRENYIQNWAIVQEYKF